MKKKNKDWILISLVHISLIATIWMFLLAVIMPAVKNDSFILNFIAFTFIIFGGIGIYTILGIKLEEIRRKYGVKFTK